MTYRVALTRAMAHQDGTTIFGDLGVDRLEAAGLQWRVLAEDTAEIRPDQVEDVDSLIVLGGESVNERTLVGGGRLRHVARFGAGYDAIDVEACTAHGVVLTTTPDAVRRPVAEATLALLFAATHNLVLKDRLVREGRWQERHHWHGTGLTGRRVGIVGLGGIGQETARLLRGLGVETVAWNRSDRREIARDLGVEMLGLDDLLGSCDLVVLTVAGNAGTRHLIGARELAMMPPHAQIVNVARGAVLDEGALVRTLDRGELGGAALDVFEQEPLAQDSLLIDRDDVILAPHALCWTQDFTAAVSRSVIDAVLAVAAGDSPPTTVNPRRL